MGEEMTTIDIPAAPTGTAERAEWARKHTDRVSVVPTSVDTDRYTPGTRDGKTVVWTGSAENLKYLAPIRPRIKHPLRVVCNRKPDFDCEFIPFAVRNICSKEIVEWN